LIDKLHPALQIFRAYHPSSDKDLAVTTTVTQTTTQMLPRNSRTCLPVLLFLDLFEDLACHTIVCRAYQYHDKSVVVTHHKV